MSRQVPSVIIPHYQKRLAEGQIGKQLIITYGKKYYKSYDHYIQITLLGSDLTILTSTDFVML